MRAVISVNFLRLLEGSAVYFDEVDMLRMVDIEGQVKSWCVYFLFECNVTRICKSDRVKSIMVVGRAEVVYSGHWFCHA